MIELQLKGFKPFKDIDISSENGVFYISEDAGIGLDYFIKILFYLGRVFIGMNTDQLWYLFDSYQIRDIKNLEILLKKDRFQYQLAISKIRQKYIVKSEEIVKDGKVIFSRSGKKYDKYEAPESELRWKTVCCNSRKNPAPMLEQMCVHDVEDFMWYPLFVASDIQRNNLKKKLFYGGKDYFAEINKRIRYLTDDYSHIEAFTDSITGYDYFKAKEIVTGEFTWKLSGKFLGLLEMLYRLINGANVVWYPETVIKADKIDGFKKVIKEFAKEKPVFVITENLLFSDKQINFKTTKDGLVCEQ